MSATNTLADAKRKLAELVAIVEKLHPSTPRPHKCLMCAQPYGPTNSDAVYSPYCITAKCGHKGHGSVCCEVPRGSHSGDCVIIGEPACGLTPAKYDCYECRRKKHTHVCLMCNQPYGATANVHQLKAKCGHAGGGHWCTVGHEVGTVTDVFMCNREPTIQDCYNCRNPQ